MISSLSQQPLILRARRVVLRSAPIAVALASTLWATACATRDLPTDSFLGVITPYRIDIVQGNAVTKEQVALIKPGMSREQVQAVLGSPMLADPFHADRWDYVFSIRSQSSEPQRRSVVAWFDGNVLKKLDAPDNLPSESAFVDAIAPVKRRASASSLELSAEQRKALPVPVKKDPQTALEPLGAIRPYPPLEPQ
jgi:outer membrane protein assembly factor BamE